MPLKETIETEYKNALKAKDIEDLAEDLGLQAVVDQLRSNREEKEARDND